MGNRYDKYTHAVALKWPRHGTAALNPKELSRNSLYYSPTFLDDNPISNSILLFFTSLDLGCEALCRRV